MIRSLPLLMMALLACTPRAPVAHDDDDAPRLALRDGEELWWGGDLVTVPEGPDAGPLDAGVFVPTPRIVVRSLAPVPVPVEPASMKDHPIAIALKGIFNDDDDIRLKAEREVLTPQLRARFKRISAVCGDLLTKQGKWTEREHNLWGLCDWSRVTCGNGDPGAWRVIITHHDETTANAIVVGYEESRVPVRLVHTDRWRIAEIDCGRDVVLERSGLLKYEVIDAGAIDAGVLAGASDAGVHDAGVLDAGAP